MGEKRRRSEKDEKVDKKRVKNEVEEKEIEEEEVVESSSSSSLDVFVDISCAALIDEALVRQLLSHLKESKDDVESIRTRASSLPFLSALLCAYTATRTTFDKSVHECLQLLERHFGVNLGALSPLVFDARARENYDRLRQLGRFLHIKLTPDQVIGWLDPQQMWVTAILADHPRMGEKPSSMYDTDFVLRLLLSVVQPGSELTCRLFVEQNCLSLAFSATSAAEEETRRLGAILLQRFLSLMMELKNDDFVEKSMVVYLIRLFKNSLETGGQRVNHVISHFFARVSKLLLSASSPVYGPICAFLTLKPTIELNQVPELFKLLLSSSTEHFKEEQTWLLNLLAGAVVDETDYKVIQNRSTLRLVCSLFSSCLSRQETRKGALGVLKAVCSIPAAAYDALVRQNMAGWIAATMQRQSLTRWEVIYLGEIFVLLLENARIYGRGKSGGRIGLALAKITLSSVTRRLGKGGDTAAGAVAHAHIQRVEKCINSDWTVKSEE